VPADAFYQWKANAKANQPYAIAMRDRRPFAFAGLWENWKDPGSQEWVRTYTILTTTPNEVVAPLHDRMPVIPHTWRQRPMAGYESRPGATDPPVPARRHGDVAGKYAREQAGK